MERLREDVARLTAELDESRHAESRLQWILDVAPVGIVRFSVSPFGRIDGDFIDLKAIGTDVTEGKVADDAGGSAAGDASGLEQIGFARAVHAHVEVTIAP